MRLFVSVIRARTVATERSSKHPEAPAVHRQHGDIRRLPGQSFSQASMRALAIAVAAAVLATACDTAPPPRPQGGAPGAPLTSVSTRSIASLTVLATDTLSDSARVLRVIPEPDGSTFAFVFEDPAMPVTSGLALAQSGSAPARLVWPDSVRNAWWSAPHVLAFTSPMGGMAVLDVHAESLDMQASADPAPAQEQPAGFDEGSVRALVTTYLDSVHVQPGGQPQNSTLHYQAREIYPSPDGTVAAVYTAANDPAGNRVNPAWYAVDIGASRIFMLDRLTGAAAIMPEGGAGWTETNRFVFAKGNNLWEAGFARRAVR